jgi:hypothetical protein
MQIRTRTLALGGVLVAALIASSAAGVFAQDKPGQKVDPKAQKAFQAEWAAAAKVADDAAAGTVPTDFPLTWQYHTMKSRDKQAFVAFTLFFDKDKQPPQSATYYLRVVNKAASGGDKAKAAEAKAKADKATAAARLDPENVELQEQAEKARAAMPKVEYAFEDVRVVELKGALQFQRAFVVPAGEYDVYFVVKQKAADLKDKKAVAKAGVLKATATIPDYYTDALATSSVIITSKVDQLTAPPTDAAANPYAFGTVKVTPTFDGKFTKKDQLSIFFYIYNNGLDKTTNKPDLTIDYAFYVKSGDAAEKFFNKTQPAALNATTLPPNFDPAAGHQLPGSIQVPLESFPEGEYRLEIKLTDKVTSKTKIENVRFTLSAG